MSTALGLDDSAVPENELNTHFKVAIAPLFSAKCIACHRPDNLKGMLDLSTRAGLLKGGDSGPALVPGSANDSPIYTRSIPHNGHRPEMPAKGEALTTAEAESLRQWIQTGALWPDAFVLREGTRADDSFWSLQPINEQIPPPFNGIPEAWNQNPIDRFVLAKMRERSLVPNPPASPQIFIRRATFDLTGLPPAPEEIDAFLEAISAQGQDIAVQQLIDRLLDSPRYGEAWGRHWLDVIRFGESRGYERNEIITNLWPFRDYVIQSINADKPFDQMIREHLAGDVIGKDQPDIEIASAFLVAGPYDDVGNGDPVAAAQIRADQMDEMIRATSEAFLGLTLGCARCHDHKFDPLLTRDYYSMFATFNGTVHGSREVATAAARQERDTQWKPLQDERARIVTRRTELNQQIGERAKTEDESARLAEFDRAIQQIDHQIAQIPTLPNLWVGTHRSAPGPFNVFIGGSTQRLGDEVTASSLSVLNNKCSSYKLEATQDEAARRVALANWLTSPDHPLVPRVLANRVWQYHFGTGIVNTPSDFGYMGGRPTHPELLDWLARELINQDWKLKPLHRLIMTSQAYRQGSMWSSANSRIDADSRFLWRFPPRRLSAEEVRDTLLSVSDRLDLKMGGPGFRLYEYQQDNVATYVPLDEHGPETFRRAIYHHNARAARVDVLTDFDCPDPAFAEPRRASTTTPLQALAMMNHKFSLVMAQSFSERLSREAQTIPAQARRAFLVAVSREPTARELKFAIEMIERHGLRAFCRSMLNSNELIQID